MQVRQPAPPPRGTQSGNGSKAALPELPQLYLNGQRIGSLAEMKALNEDGQLSARLDEFRMEYITTPARSTARRRRQALRRARRARGRSGDHVRQGDEVRDVQRERVDGARAGTPTSSSAR